MTTIALVIAITLTASPVVKALTFSLEGVGGWPNQAHYDAAYNAARSAIDRYNSYGNFNAINSHVYIYYDSGIGTAQANFGGSVGFGGTYPAERVMMHEMGHFLGLPNWASGGWNGTGSGMMAGGVWHGPITNQLIQQFNGEGAQIHGDSAHFWPYGLNYDNEGSEINKQRQVAMVYAMRGDLGIGPSSHPSAATSVVLTADDPFGTSGFNYKDRWSDGYFAHAGADYLTDDFLLRTPASSSSFTFSGDSLTVNNANGISGGLLYKGQGASGVTTIDNLILDGGYVRHANGAGDLFQLDGTMTLNGNPTIDAAQGNIKILSPVGGTGSLNLRGSSNFTVTLSNSNNTYSGPTVVQNITLDLQGSTGFGHTTVAGGAALVGDGQVRGRLTAASGATVRVGSDGIPLGYPHTVVDDFEAYAIGEVRNVASPPWTAHQNTSYADIELVASNRVLSYGWASDFRGASRELESSAAVGEDETATYFFRFNSQTADPDHSIGLGDTATTTGVSFSDFESQLRFKADNSPSTFAVDARSGGSFTSTLASGMAPNSWYNAWMVVDNYSDTYDIYINTGDGDATLSHKINSMPLAFRNGTSSPLDKVLALAGPAEIDNGVRIDDLVYQQGFDLTNPLSRTPSLISETLNIGGDFNLQAGATLAIDLAETAHDSVDVTGSAILNGLLEVKLDAGYEPMSNESFIVLNANNIVNSLTLGGPDGSRFTLANSTSTELVLTFVAGLPGDYNNDGTVNLADYTLWRDNLGAPTGTLVNDPNPGAIGVAQYTTWKANFGNTSSPPAAFKAATVPEPCSVTLISLFLVLTLAGPRRR